MDPLVESDVPNPFFFIFDLCIYHMTLKLFPHVSTSLPGWQTPRGEPNEKCWDHTEGQGRVTKSLPKFQQAASFHVGPRLSNKLSRKTSEVITEKNRDLVPG